MQRWRRRNPYVAVPAAGACVLVLLVACASDKPSKSTGRVQAASGIRTTVTHQVQPMGMGARREAPSPNTAVLEVGQRFSEALLKLQRHGATDITAQVALKRSGRPALGHRRRWFTLRDRTCITVVGSGPNSATLKVIEIWTGKCDRGFPGMTSGWFATAHKVRKISLPSTTGGH